MSETRSHKIILSDLEVGKAVIAEFEKSLIGVYIEELEQCEQFMYNELLEKIKSDPLDDVDLAISRFNSFMELETLHKEEGSVHNTYPIDIMKDSSYEKRGRDIDIYFSLIEIEFDRHMIKRYKGEKDFLRAKIETIHNTIKDKIIKCKFDW